MSFHTRITELLGIQYPIMQGGMRWAARAELGSREQRWRPGNDIRAHPARQSGAGE
jgi:hypothetical protein